jgi:hypothetical protein
MAKKIGKKYLGVHLDILCSPIKIHGNEIFYGMCKKDNIWCSKIAIRDFFYLLTHATKEKKINKILWVYIECSDVQLRFFVQFFDFKIHFKCIFMINVFNFKCIFIINVFSPMDQNTMSRYT